MAVAPRSDRIPTSICQGLDKTSWELNQQSESLPIGASQQPKANSSDLCPGEGDVGRNVPRSVQRTRRNGARGNSVTGREFVSALAHPIPHPQAPLWSDYRRGKSGWKRGRRVWSGTAQAETQRRSFLQKQFSIGRAFPPLLQCPSFHCQQSLRERVPLLTVLIG